MQIYNHYETITIPKLMYAKYQNMRYPVINNKLPMVYGSANFAGEI